MSRTISKYGFDKGALTRVTRDYIRNQFMPANCRVFPSFLFVILDAYNQRAFITVPLMTFALVHRVTFHFLRNYWEVYPFLSWHVFQRFILLEHKTADRKRRQNQAIQMVKRKSTENEMKVKCNQLPTRYARINKTLRFPLLQHSLLPAH